MRNCQKRNGQYFHGEEGLQRGDGSLPPLLATAASYVWFNLGHSARQIEDYHEAARAFLRLVTFEPEHFKAWNNLAACYVDLKQQPRPERL